MRVVLEEARVADAAAIAALRLAASRDLTARFGRGTWSYAAESEGGVRVDLLTSKVLVAHLGGTAVATLRLSTRSPWMRPMDFFTPAHRPVYLTSMAVAPKLQRHGLGRACLEQALDAAREMNADVIRLDAYDAPAGAGDFYAKAGFTDVRRADYNGTPLIFFERFIPVRQPANAA